MYWIYKNKNNTFVRQNGLLSNIMCPLFTLGMEVQVVTKNTKIIPSEAENRFQFTYI